MRHYLKAKRDEILIAVCAGCGEEKEIASYIRDDNFQLVPFCQDCFDGKVHKMKRKENEGEWDLA